MFLFWQVFSFVGGNDIWCFLDATNLQGGSGGWRVEVNVVGKKGGSVADKVGIGGGTADRVGCLVGSIVGVGGGKLFFKYEYNGCGGCW